MAGALGEANPAGGPVKGRADPRAALWSHPGCPNTFGKAEAGGKTAMKMADIFALFFTLRESGWLFPLARFP